MNEIEIIIDKIKLGMQKSHRDTFKFTGSPANRFGAEYLFTVNVAQAIGEINSFGGEPYRIHIEARVKDVALDCLPVIKKSSSGWIKNSTIFRHSQKKPTIGRDGRIDIAIYKEGDASLYYDHVPFCIIELKSFNPPSNKIIEDLKRNTELLRASGPTGDSSLQAGIFSAAHQINKFYDDRKLKESIASIKSKYSKHCSKLGNKNDLNIILRHFELSNEINGDVIHDMEESYIDRSTRHYFIGIIVIITLKKNNIHIKHSLDTDLRL